MAQAPFAVDVGPTERAFAVDVEEAPEAVAAPVTKADLGLDQVDNTRDIDKPISTATQQALNEKLDSDDPILGGPRPPTPHAASHGEVGSDPLTLTMAQITGLVSALANKADAGVSGVSLGETAITAYRGDRGKVAYDHSLLTGNPHGTAIGDIAGLTAALGGKEPSITSPAAPTTKYWRGDKTWVLLDKAAVGLDQVDNIADASKTFTQAQITNLLSALAAKADLVGGFLATSQIPQVAISDVFTAASQSAMLALTAQRGDLAIRTDTGHRFILSTDSPTTLSDWVDLGAATDAVTSVNSQVGIVVLGKADVGLGNVDNTSDVNKPVSTAQAAADAAILGKPVALTGATANARFAGGTASGAPASGTFQAGDFVITQDGTLRIYTGASWGGLYQLSSSAPPAIGTATAGTASSGAHSDHTHAQQAAVQPTGITGASSASRYIGGTGGGTSPSSGTFIAGDFGFDTNGRLWICTVGGSPGTWSVYGTVSNATPQALGTPAAGSSIQVSRADHVHPLPPTFDPAAALGLKLVSGDPAQAAGTFQPLAGYLYLMKIPVPVTTTFTNLLWNITVGGATLNNCYSVLYNSSGTLLDQSADQSASWVSAGLKTVPLASAQAVTGGATTFVWAGIIIGAGSTTAPTFSVANTNTAVLNFGLSLAQSRSGLYGGGSYVAAPASITPASITQRSQFWPVGVT